jgi:hypothetical protein
MKNFAYILQKYCICIGVCKSRMHPDIKLCGKEPRAGTRFVRFTIQSKVRNLTRLTSDTDLKFEDKDFN